MYVIKDLVPDMTNFYDQYKSVKPWLQRKVHCCPRRPMRCSNSAPGTDDTALSGGCAALCRPLPISQ